MSLGAYVLTTSGELVELVSAFLTNGKPENVHTRTHMNIYTQCIHRNFSTEVKHILSHTSDGKPKVFIAMQCT